MWLTGLTEFVR